LIIIIIIIIIVVVISFHIKYQIIDFFQNLKIVLVENLNSKSFIYWQLNVMKMVRFTDKEKKFIPEILEDIVNLLINKNIISDKEINDILTKYQQ
jgi:hypothetical protein